MSNKSQNSEALSGNDNSKVYISNINKTIEEDDIKRKFSEFGVIKSLILKKKENNVTYSFIQYEKPQEAKAAITEMDKKVFFDRILKVQYGKGGNKGEAHYHPRNFNAYKNFNNSNDRYYDNKNSRIDQKRQSYDRRRSYTPESSYDSLDRDYRKRDRSPRRIERRERDYSPRDKYARRSRSRSYEKAKRQYRGYYKQEDRSQRYKILKDYDRNPDKYYDEKRHRDQKYGDYRRRDFEKYDKYENERYARRSYSKSPIRTKEMDKYIRPSDYIKPEYKTEYKPEYRSDYKSDYKVDRRDSFDRRKEYPPMNPGDQRKDSKQFNNFSGRKNFQNRRRSNSREKMYVRADER